MPDAAKPEIVIADKSPPKPAPAEGQRWSFPTNGRGPGRSIATLMRPYLGRAWEGMYGHQAIIVDTAHPDIRFEGMDWSLWLPSGNLPTVIPAGFRVGQIYAVGIYGNACVVGIDQVDQVNAGACRVVVYEVRGNEWKYWRGRTITLHDTLMNAMLVGDSVWDPVCTPADVQARVVPAAAAEAHVGKLLDSMTVKPALAAAKTCTAMCETCLRVECGKLATHGGDCRCFDHMDANPACGCTQETVCSAHEKPNQSAGPGDVLPPYEPPTLKPLPGRREVSMNGRDWLRYELLAEPEPFKSYPHWQILGPAGEVLIFHDDKPSPPPTCERTTASEPCGKPASFRPSSKGGTVALCDACHLDVEKDIAHYTARRVEHVRARMRLVDMDFNARGLGAPEPRACSPTLFGGIWNIGR